MAGTQASTLQSAISSVDPCFVHSGSDPPVSVPKMPLATLVSTCQGQSRLAGGRVASRSRPPSILFHGRIQRAFLLHHLHGFFDRGLGRDGDSIMDHEVFRLQLEKILAASNARRTSTSLMNPLTSLLLFKKQAGSRVKISTGERRGMARKRNTEEEIIGQVRTIEIELGKGLPS